MTTQQNHLVVTNSKANVKAAIKFLASIGLRVKPSPVTNIENRIAFECLAAPKELMRILDSHNVLNEFDDETTLELCKLVHGANILAPGQAGDSKFGTCDSGVWYDLRINSDQIGRCIQLTRTSKTTSVITMFEEEL